MADKELPADTDPFTLGDVKSCIAGTAPPSYMDVIGQHETSVTISTPSAPAPSLAYIDIMPRLTKPGDLHNKMAPEFQLFPEILRGANAWLASHPSLAVWKCETVERKVLQDQGESDLGVRVDLDSMSYKESIWGCNCYVFGLRLWLTPRPEKQMAGQEIGLVNILPTPKEVKYQQISRVGGLGFHHYMTTSRTHTMITYESLERSIEDFNAKAKDQPIPGTILNVETATLKFAEGFERKSDQEVADMSSWHETSGMKARRLTQILRLFYIRGPSTTVRLEMAEFLPRQLNQPSFGKPIRFADFSSAEDALASWLRDQSGIKVLNIETREAKYNTFFNQSLKIDTGCTDDFDFPAFETSRLRFLRVFFTSAPDMASYAYTALTSRIFPPVRLKGVNRFETMVQTMTRVDAWLKATGLPIFGVETLYFLDEGGAATFKKSQYNLRGFAGKSYVTAIRLYFPTTFTEPAAHLLPPLPKGADGSSSTCTLL